MLCPDSKWGRRYGLERASLGVDVGACEEEYFV